MTNAQRIVITGFIAVNCLAYLLMCYDKLQSKRKGPRVPERSLMLVACLFGAGGVYLGTKAPLYHKSSKKQFRFAVPLLLILNGAILIYVVFKWMR